MIKKIACFSVALVILAALGLLLLKSTVLNPTNTAMRLYTQAHRLMSAADSLDEEGQSTLAEKGYRQALARLERIDAEYKDLPRMDKAASLLTKCRRRIAPYDSARGAMESMTGALCEMTESDPDEYLAYWDFLISAEKAVGDGWDELRDDLKDRLAAFSHDAFKEYVKQAGAVLTGASMELTGERQDKESVILSTRWTRGRATEDVSYWMMQRNGKWIMWDFEFEGYQAAAVPVLREAIKRCTAQASLQDFLDSADFDAKLEEACVALVLGAQRNLPE